MSEEKMPTGQYFNPKIIDYSLDYYAILGLQKGCLPPGNNTEEREEIVHILAEGYGKSVMKAHPDMGGSDDAFKLVVRAHTILSNFLYRKIYESDGAWKPRMAEQSSDFVVDWSKFGTYEQGTLADTLGYGLCLSIRARCAELGLVPAFIPTFTEHNYEWDWVIQGRDAKLALALVDDVDDVLRLTSGQNNLQESLPFKIYFCIPRAALQFVRGEKEIITYDDGSVDDYIMNGRLAGAGYADYNLLETTHLDEAQAYIAPGGQLENDLSSFMAGTLNSKLVTNKENEVRIVKSSDLQALDAAAIRQILRMKAPLTQRNDRAADFLKDLPEDRATTRG